MEVRKAAVEALGALGEHAAPAVADIAAALNNGEMQDPSSWVRC